MLGDDWDLVDQSSFLRKPVPAERQVFRTGVASDAALLGLRHDGPPARTTFEAGSLETKGHPLFRLKATSQADFQATRQAAAEAKRAKENELFRQITNPPRFEGDEPQPPKRSQKYYQAIMKADYKRNEMWRKEKDADDKALANLAAEAAKRKALQLEGLASHRASGSDSDTTSDSDKDESEPEDAGPLVPYYGQMKVDIEIVLQGAPKPKDRKGGIKYNADGTIASGGARGGHRGVTPESSKSSESTPRIDFSEELQALQEEMKEGTESEKSSDDGLPEGLRLKRMNILNNPDPRFTLGIGGTVYFIPDAERYANGPSLPPPPPPSKFGTHKVHLKPRLPLEISNHRYEDEHPYIWPEKQWQPTNEDRLRLEEKMRTVDLYSATNTAMALIPSPKLNRKSHVQKHKRRLGKYVKDEMEKSLAWTSYIHRTKLQFQAETEELKELLAAKDQGLKDHHQSSVDSLSTREPGSMMRHSVSTGSVSFPSGSQVLSP